MHEGFIGFIERSDAIAALRENSLIAIEEEQDGTTYLHMRRHVQQLMHDRLQNCGAATEAAAVATLLLASAFSCQDDSPTCSKLLPHARAALDRSPDTIDELDDNGWLAYRKRQLQQRVAGHSRRLDTAEISQAFMERDCNLRAAEIVARRIDEFRPDVKRRLVREAFELAENQYLQPIRDVFSVQPEEFQIEIRLALDRGCELMKNCRELIAQDATEQISKLVSENLDQFPLHLQNQLQQAYGSLSEQDGTFFDRYLRMQRESEARSGLRSLLGVPQPLRIPVRSKNLWSRLVGWRNRD